jgi:hypothetical protein
VAGLIAAGISFARLMGWIPLTDDQFNSLMIFIGLALPIGFSLWARSKTTPLAAPKTVEGEPAALVRKDVALRAGLAPEGKP